ncbi:MAG: diguanylate cyclase domain-containing protein, partial [Acidimicrobiales bacterium]
MPASQNPDASPEDVVCRYDTLLAVLQEGVLVQDAELRVVEANAAAEVLFGVAEGALVGTIDPARAAVDEDYRHLEPGGTPAALALAGGLSHRGQVLGIQPGEAGALRWFSVNAVSLSAAGSDSPHAVVSSFTDVTERKALEIELTHLALHDGLTGLANRTLLVDRVGHAMARQSRRQPDPTVGVSVLFIDIDGFKSINDRLGNRV